MSADGNCLPCSHGNKTILVDNQAAADMQLFYTKLAGVLGGGISKDAASFDQESIGSP